MSAIPNIPERILSDLIKIDGVDSLAVASPEGLFMTTGLESPHSRTFASMSEMMLTMSNRDNESQMPGKMVVESGHGKFIAVNAGSRAMIMALAVHNTGLESVIEEMEKAAKEIKNSYEAFK